MFTHKVLFFDPRIRSNGVFIAKSEQEKDAFLDLAARLGVRTIVYRIDLTKP